MTASSFVFDTGALSLFYADDERFRRIVDDISGKGAAGLIASVTLSEFYYKTCQKLGRDVATLWSRQLSERMQVVIADVDLSLAAGLEKCRNDKLSLADSFALALARRSHATLLTTDSELAKVRDPKVRHFAV